MRKIDRQFEMDKTPGYERVRLDSGSVLLLPSESAEQFKQQLRAREQEAASQRREALHQQQVEKLSAPKAEKHARIARPSAKQPHGARPKKGWYRVLPGLGDIERELHSGGSPGDHSEKEVADRLRKARESLVELGPDRRLVLPRQWRKSLDRLESELPHFREPIGLVRHSLALADATGKAVRIPPMLLLGPPGLGKTYFSHQLAGLLGVPHGVVSFDQPSYGGQLRGTDSAWGNSQTGLLFKMICMGECANPVVVLDELDKSATGSGRHDIDPLAQLHGALEPESSRRIVDISVQVEFDASMVTYVATANSVCGLEAPMLSRFEVFGIEAPTPADSVGIAHAVVAKSLERLGLAERVAFERKAIYLLAHLSPRMMVRATDRSVATAVFEGRGLVMEQDIWCAIRIQGGPTLLH